MICCFRHIILAPGGLEGAFWIEKRRSPPPERNGYRTSDGPSAYACRVAHRSRLSSLRGAESHAGRRPRGDRPRTALHASHAQERQADVGADDQLRPARLDDRRGRLPLPADPSLHRRAVAADPGLSAPGVDGVCRAIRLRRRPAWSTSMAPMPAWACIRTAMKKTSPPRSSRCRSATPACSGSAGPGATTRPHAFRLASGDALVLGGQARLAFHGVDRIIPGTSSLLAGGGRINLTLRRVTRPA